MRRQSGVEGKPGHNQNLSNSAEAFIKPAASEKRAKQSYFTDAIIGIITMRKCQEDSGLNPCPEMDVREE